MTSFASRCQEENGIVTLDVEVVDTCMSACLDFFDRESTTMYISLEELTKAVGETVEGDVLIVEHNDTSILSICGKDESEKQRRVKFLQSLR